MLYVLSKANELAPGFLVVVLVVVVLKKPGAPLKINLHQVFKVGFSEIFAQNHAFKAIFSLVLEKS